MLEVGQTLYYVPSQRHGGDPREVKVTKVGRKWATVQEGVWFTEKIDLDTLVADGGVYSSPGQCYLSKTHYEEVLAESEAWKRFRSVIDRTFRAPAGVSLEDINYAYTVLKIDPSKYQ